MNNNNHTLYIYFITAKTTKNTILTNYFTKKQVYLYSLVKQISKNIGFKNCYFYLFISHTIKQKKLCFMDRSVIEMILNNDQTKFARTTMKKV